MTDGDVTLTGIQDTCDKPSLLEGSCNPFTRVGTKQGTWMNGDPRPEVNFVYTCRSLDSGPPTEEGGVFHDVAMIGHNEETGATCFFQSFPTSRIRSFPSPLTAGGTPDYGTVDADAIWDRPGATAGIGCNGCHQADPWIHSPWIDQVAHPDDPTRPIVPWTEYLGVETPPGYHVVGTSFYRWEMTSIEPADNSCLTCHRIAPGDSCVDFVSYSSGEPSFLPLSDFARSFPQSTWMPPEFTGSESEWMTEFQEDVDEILSCCQGPNQDFCNRTPVPEGQVYLDPDAPDPATLVVDTGFTGGGDTAIPCVAPDDDLGSAVGASVASGTTCGMGHDFVRSCGEIATDGEDIAFEWTAPETGLYTFDTLGSNFDTTLSFRTPCTFGNAEFACNDDEGSVQSSLSFDFVAGDSVVVVIDTYAGPECGGYVLNITPP